MILLSAIWAVVLVLCERSVAIEALRPFSTLLTHETNLGIFSSNMILISKSDMN